MKLGSSGCASSKVGSEPVQSPSHARLLGSSKLNEVEIDGPVGRSMA